MRQRRGVLPRWSPSRGDRLSGERGSQGVIPRSIASASWDPVRIASFYLSPQTRSIRTSELGQHLGFNKPPSGSRVLLEPEKPKSCWTSAPVCRPRQ